MYQGVMKKSLPAVLAAVLGIGLVAGPAQAAVYNLRADLTIKTMPDGRQVRMWGFACDSATPPAVCPNPGVVTVPGPELTVAPGDADLTINLTNNLPEPVSMVIQGQVTAMTPVFITDSQGTPRVRSFTAETGVLPADNTTTYSWANLKPGTFLYESGTHLAVQVPMGLYGAMKKDATPAPQAYPGINYDTEAVIFFSEVDPDLNAAVAGDPMIIGSTPIFGTPAFPSSIHFTPRYYLVNGYPFPSGDTHTYVGLANQSVLLRFLNAGLAMRSPVVIGSYLQVVAEDGNLYPDPKTQYSLDLAAGKTLDAIGTFANGYYPIFDRRLGLTNADTSTGGMLTYLEVGPDHMTGGQATLNVTKAGPGTGTVVSSSLPGGINCGAACSEHYLPVTELRLSAKADPGSVLSGWTGCTQVVGLSDCLLTLPAAGEAAAVTATFVTANARVGVFRGGAWLLDKDALGWQGLGVDGYLPSFGIATDIPVAGDMNGDGFTEVGVFRQGQWLFDLDNSGSWSDCTTTGGLDLCLGQFGVAGDIPVTGDWNGDGTTEIGVYRQGRWFFDRDGSGTWSANVDAFKLSFGTATDTPVTGDWDGNGTTEIGVYRGGTWFIDYNGNGQWNGIAGGDRVYSFGTPTDLPATLDWNGDGKSEIAVFRASSGIWILDNGSGQWEAGGIDPVITFGAPIDKPVTGIWR